MDTNAVRADSLARIDATYSAFVQAVNSSARLRAFFKRMFKSSQDALRLWSLLFGVGDIQTFMTVVSQEQIFKGRAGYKVVTLDKALAAAKAYDDEVAAGRKFGAYKRVGQEYGLFPSTVKQVVGEVAKADAELRLRPEDEIAVKAMALPVVFGAMTREKR